MESLAKFIGGEHDGQLVPNELLENETIDMPIKKGRSMNNFPYQRYEQITYINPNGSKRNFFALQYMSADQIKISMIRIIKEERSIENVGNSRKLHPTD